MSRRHRPLNICGSTIYKIAQNFYEDVKNSQGTLGTVVTKIDPLVALISAPVINVIESQSKSAIEFADDRILEFESKIETAFPSSTLAFDAVDEVLDIVEILPTKLDGVYKSNFPSGITMDQFVAWVYALLIFLLKLCVSFLNHGGLPDKEITVDITYNITKRGSASSISSPSNYLKNRLAWMKCSYKEILEKHEKEKEQKREQETVKCSYKDILEKGTQHEYSSNTTNVTLLSKNNEESKNYIFVKADEREDGEETPKDPLGGIRIKGDPSLQLLDTSWHIKAQ